MSDNKLSNDSVSREELERLRLRLKLQEGEERLLALRSNTPNKIQVDSVAPPFSRHRSARSAINEYGAWAGPIALVAAIASALRPLPDPQKVDATAINTQDLKQSYDAYVDTIKKWHDYETVRANSEACRWRQVGSAFAKQGYIISFPHDSVEWKSERMDNKKSPRSEAPLWSVVNDCPDMPDPPTSK